MAEKKKNDAVKRKALGTILSRKRDAYIKDRAMLERQFLIDLRQYRGEYDPDVLARIPEDKSRAYPRDTRTKVKGFTTKMMEMMFPATDVNWDLVVTPKPSIPEGDLAAVINAMQQAELVASQAEQRQPGQLTSDKIEQAVMAFAEARRDRMQKRIMDQLMDTPVDWPATAKRIVRSGAIYGYGVVKSPVVRTQRERIFRPNNETGEWEAKTITEKRPYPVFCSVWNIYPDLSAPSWDEQEGLFERYVLSRNGVVKLAKRSGFDSEFINKYLADNTKGNYKSKAYEAELKVLSKSEASVSDFEGRRYEVFRWFGYVPAARLKDAGVDVPDGKVNSDILADVWLLDDNVIYADTAPFGDKPSDVYHAYFYTEDEDAGLTGISMPQELRDRQMSICASTRALYDNMAATAGPMYEVAVDTLKLGQNMRSFHAFGVVEREGEGADLQHPAVRTIQVNSHIPEIQGILADERQQFDVESNLPSWLFGNAQPLGEAFRTSSNMSQMAGGGNMITKDHVREFDKFTGSVIGSLLAWNMEFGPEEDKGDFQVRTKGNISLVAKEVRGAALDQFMTTLTPSERSLLKERETLIQRLKARDLPVDLVVDADEAERIKQAQAQAQAQAQQITDANTQAKTDKLTAEAEKIRQTVQAQVTQIMAQAENMKAGANYQTRKAQLDTMNAMLQNVIASIQERGNPNG